MKNLINEGSVKNGVSIEQEIRMLEADQKELVVTLTSLGLSVVGLITGFGEVADAANAALFYSTGHPILGTLSGLSALPIPLVEQALGLAVGSCLLIKVIWISAKIVKNAIVIATKNKFVKPAYIFVQRTGRFFQSVSEKGKNTIKLIQNEIAHNNMKPGYINLNAEINFSGGRDLFQKLLAALKKIANWAKTQWKKLDTQPISTVTTKTPQTSNGKPNSIFVTENKTNYGGGSIFNLNETNKAIYKGRNSVINYSKLLDPANQGKLPRNNIFKIDK